MTTIQRQKCGRCKMNMTLDKYVKKRDDTYTKRCIECNLYCKNTSARCICPHGNKKFRCVDCNGIGLCKHKKQKGLCIECGGSEICEHKKEKRRCKLCSDPKKVIIDGWIRNCRTKDKKLNLFDIVNYIDKCFCYSLLEEYPNCYYCKVELQYVIYQGDLATIERLDNDIGQNKSNCVIACLHCNVSKLSNK